MSRFRVYDLRRADHRADGGNVQGYLSRLHDRFHNAIHAETRVYTCRSWHAAAGATTPYELHWNDDELPGEQFLGSFGWVVGHELAERVEAEFAQGNAVRLFIFNSDADLCFEEVLEPIPTEGTAPCVCHQALQHSFATVRDAVFGLDYDAILKSSEQIARSEKKWMSLYRCRSCGTLWAEGCFDSGHMMLYYLFPAPTTDDPARWLHEAAAELPR